MRLLNWIEEKRNSQFRSDCMTNVTSQKTFVLPDHGELGSDAQ